MDFYGFYMGEEFEAWKYLGAQVSSRGTTFRTFAPNALRISLIGDFNQWQETPMEKIYDGHCPGGKRIHAVQIPDLPPGRFFSGSLRSLRTLFRAPAAQRFRNLQPEAPFFP